MYYIVETQKSFDQTASDLETVVKNQNYGVLHIHDIGTTLRSKKIPFNEECRVFEVCNPEQAAKVLSNDMRLNMALPCSISVFTDNGITKIGLIKPQEMLTNLSQDPKIVEIASSVEAQLMRIVDLTQQDPLQKNDEAIKLELHP